MYYYRPPSAIASFNYSNSVFLFTKAIVLVNRLQAQLSYYI